MDKKAIQRLLGNPTTRADVAARLERGEYKGEAATLVRSLLNATRFS